MLESLKLSLDGHLKEIWDTSSTEYNDGLKNLKRINIIVGKNATGKTLLLEEIWNTQPTAAAMLTEDSYRKAVGHQMLSDELRQCVRQKLREVFPLPDIAINSKVPATKLSHGIRRMWRSVIGIEEAPGGIILVDEIENGIHYTVFKDMWRVITGMCADNNTQLFVTTQSPECLEQISGPEDMFSLIRMERTEDGLCARQFDGGTLLSAIEQNIDFR